MQDIPLITWDSDPLTQQELADLEAAIGSLPVDYRQFLLSRNGGRTLDEKVECRNPDHPDDNFGVTAFSSIDPMFPPIVLKTTLHRKPVHFIKIASSYDTPFLMQINGPEAGAVYFWYWVLEELWDAQDAGRKYLPKLTSLRKLASSFTEFVNSLIRINLEQVPKLEEMDRNVENFAKYGDRYYNNAKKFFDRLSVDELNECWPKNDEYAIPALAYAASWSQIRICRYLLSRGVDVHQESTFTRCRNNYEIAKMFIQAGATAEELQELLRAAAFGIHSTSAAEEHANVIRHLVKLGVQPNFKKRATLEEWKRGIEGIHCKKMIKFLRDSIAFPDSIISLIQDKVSKPNYDSLAQ